jgi:hypothetical protein
LTRRGWGADFDLESQRIKLDENALQIAENQEVAMSNRRKLMEATRGRNLFAPLGALSAREASAAC